MSTAPGHARRRILVADDDADILELVALRLTKAGYEVLKAADGEAALAQAIEHLPDLAVLDVMMPGLSGHEVTGRLRALERTAGVPVILLTARVQDSDVARGYQAGADDYMEKPFRPQDLLARVEALLGPAAAAAAAAAKTPISR